MTTYSEQSGNAATYGEAFPGETIWDLGTTKWDVSGGAATTAWDADPAISYTTESSNTPTWAEQ